MVERISMDELECTLEDWKVIPADFGRPEYYRAELSLDEARVPEFIELLDRDQASISVDGGEAKVLRFGRMVWQRESDAVRRVLVYLFPPTDSDDSPSAGQPARTHTEERVLWSKAAIGALLDELGAVGVLTPAAIERVVAKGDLAVKTDWFELYEAEDLEPYRR